MHDPLDGDGVLSIPELSTVSLYKCETFLLPIIPISMINFIIAKQYKQTNNLLHPSPISSFIISFQCCHTNITGVPKVTYDTTAPS
jgi:hypothetical protein